jgi:hypothetical protein
MFQNRRCRDQKGCLHQVVKGLLLQQARACTSRGAHKFPPKLTSSGIVWVVFPAWSPIVVAVEKLYKSANMTDCTVDAEISTCSAERLACCWRAASPKGSGGENQAFNLVWPSPRQCSAVFVTSRVSKVNGLPHTRNASPLFSPTCLRAAV